MPALSRASSQDSPHNYLERRWHCPCVTGEDRLAGAGGKGALAKGTQWEARKYTQDFSFQSQHFHFSFARHARAVLHMWELRAPVMS